MLNLSDFSHLTFDCYGTLIDWETGLLAAMRRVLDAHGATPADDDLLERYARHEAALERPSCTRAACTACRRG